MLEAVLCQVCLPCLVWYSVSIQRHMHLAFMRTSLDADHHGGHSASHQQSSNTAAHVEGGPFRTAATALFLGTIKFVGVKVVVYALQHPCSQVK